MNAVCTVYIPRFCRGANTHYSTTHCNIERVSVTPHKTHMIGEACAALTIPNKLLSPKKKPCARRRLDSHDHVRSQHGGATKKPPQCHATPVPLFAPSRRSPSRATHEVPSHSPDSLPSTNFCSRLFQPSHHLPLLLRPYTAATSTSRAAAAAPPPPPAPLLANDDENENLLLLPACRQPRSVWSRPVLMPRGRG